MTLHPSMEQLHDVANPKILYEILCNDLFFFFFQAEDGIRDLTVTGVQTCALPIWFRKWIGTWTRGRLGRLMLLRKRCRAQPRLRGARNQGRRNRFRRQDLRWRGGIGRASCRERV